MPSCFVIMPITTPPSFVDRYGGDGDHFLHVLEHLFRPAIEGVGYEVVPPSAAGSDVIQAEIIRNLDEADLVLCDMSSLNANVFFELGIRTALDQPVATVRDKLTETIPFDHSIVNCHQYDGRLEPWGLQSQIDALTAHISACVSRSGGSNTLWKYFGVEANARVGSGGTTEDDKLDYLVRQMEELRSDVVQRPVSPPAQWLHQPVVAGSSSLSHPGFILITGGSSSALVRESLVDDIPAGVRDLLLEAADVSRTLGARFDVYVGKVGGLVLDFGVYAVSEEIVGALTRAAEERNLNLKLRGSSKKARALFRAAGVLLDVQDADERLIARSWPPPS